MFGVTLNGGYSEFVICTPNSLLKLPDSIPFEEGCFLYCTAAVALRALKYHAKLQSGERVLITGASGGVGVHAIQIAKHMGAFVIATTTSKDKTEFLKELGADEVIVGPPFESQVSHPVDVILELVGERTLLSAMKCLGTKGRLVFVGNVNLARIPVGFGGWITFGR
jgi:acryloyl-coenzyme A reductase